MEIEKIRADLRLEGLICYITDFLDNPIELSNDNFGTSRKNLIYPEFNLGGRLGGVSDIDFGNKALGSLYEVMPLLYPPDLGSYHKQGLGSGFGAHYSSLDLGRWLLEGGNIYNYLDWRGIGDGVGYYLTRTGKLGYVRRIGSRVIRLSIRAQRGAECNEVKHPYLFYNISGRYPAHRLLCSVYHEPQWEKPDLLVDHLFGDTMDNSVELLTPVTASENQLKRKTWRGDLSKEDILSLCESDPGLTVYGIADHFGICANQVYYLTGWERGYRDRRWLDLDLDNAWRILRLELVYDHRWQRGEGREVEDITYSHGSYWIRVKVNGVGEVMKLSIR